MSISNIRDISTKNEFRQMEDRLRRLESQISTVVKNSSNITQHPTLQSLDFASSGHTGFASSSSIPFGGNPTAQVGLTAVNGAASTFTRSDGAPSLDQAISPTWTGTHDFSSATVTGLDHMLDSGSPDDTIQDELVFDANIFLDSGELT